MLLVLILAFWFVKNKFNKNDIEPYFVVEVCDSDYFSGFCIKIIEKNYFIVSVCATEFCNEVFCR